MFEDGLAFEMTTGELAMGKGDPVPEARDIRDIFLLKAKVSVFSCRSPRDVKAVRIATWRAEATMF